MIINHDHYFIEQGKQSPFLKNFSLIMQVFTRKLYYLTGAELLHKMVLGNLCDIFTLQQLPYKSEEKFKTAQQISYS